MKSKPDNSNTDQEYVYSSGPAHTLKMFSSRTAGKQAAWLLPFLKPGGIIGIHDIDHGGYLIAPDDGLLERWLVVVETYMANAGMHTRLGRYRGNRSRYSRGG